MVPRENKNNAYSKFGGTDKEYYGISEVAYIVWGNCGVTGRKNCKNYKTGEASWSVCSTPDRVVRVRVLGPVSRKSRKLFGPEKPFVKLPATCFGTIFFKHVFKVTKRKMTVKFDDLSPLRS